MAEKKSNSKRTRNFATVVYPESAPADWMSILSDQCIPCFISPLHDQDINPGGEAKKPHYHVLLAFEGVKTTEQARTVFDMIGGVGCEVVQSLRGYTRYLCHLDNPEKHQYSPQDVIAYGGADYFSCIGLPTDKYKAIQEMMDFCRVNHIVAFCDLLDAAAFEHYDWFRVLCDNGTVVMKEYLKSLSWNLSRSLN